jgi:hypothetical protein
MATNYVIYGVEKLKGKILQVNKAWMLHDVFICSSKVWG